MKFLDLSGYGFSGKHAVIDLVREFAGYHVPEFQFEFALFRAPGGILELEHALIEHWSPVRSDAAVRRFKRLVARVGTKNSYLSPRTWFQAVGWNYDERYRGRFIARSEKYLSEIVQAQWRTNWPFPMLQVEGPQLFARKLGALLRLPGALDFEVYLAGRSDFVDCTKRYLRDVLTADADPGTSAVVMHNAFEPFRPERCLKYFDDVRCIVVDRDPRDTYVQQLTYRPMAVGPDEFIKRYRMQREMTAGRRSEDPRILRLRFEELVTDYDRVLPAIRTHLGADTASHIAPKRHFDPDKSARNVGLWRQHPKQSEIDRIAHDLAEYCSDAAGF